MDTPQEFLVVYEDLWRNKESVRTTKIGDAIKQFVESHNLISEEEIDYERYNSDDPYDVGTFGLGFYDIDFSDDIDENAGRIMIFTL